MVAKNVVELLCNHVTLELERIDRMYLNGCVPGVQTPAGFAYFAMRQLGMPIPSTAAVAGMRDRFVAAIDSPLARRVAGRAQGGQRQRLAHGQLVVLHGRVDGLRRSEVTSSYQASRAGSTATSVGPSLTPVVAYASQAEPVVASTWNRKRSCSSPVVAPVALPGRAVNSL